MDPIVAGSLITGALSSAVGLGGIISSNVANQQNIQFQREQNQTNLDWQERMINEQRAYDDPVHQMERMRAAGINPTFAGSQMLNPGNTQPSPEPATQAPQYFDPARAYGSMSDNLAQTSGNIIEAYKVKSQQELNAANVDRIRYNMLVQERKLEKELDNLDWDVYLKKANFRKVLSETANVDEDTYRLKLQNALSSATIQDKIEQCALSTLKLQLENVGLRWDNLNKERQNELLSAQIEETKAHVSTLYAQAYYYRKAGAAAESQAQSAARQADSAARQATVAEQRLAQDDRHFRSNYRKDVTKFITDCTQAGAKFALEEAKAQKYRFLGIDFRINTTTYEAHQEIENYMSFLANLDEVFYRDMVQPETQVNK